MLRVRQILGFIDFDKVCHLLPEYNQFQVNQKKSFPGFAYKYPFNPSRFGLFTEELIKAALQTKVDDWDSMIVATFIEMFNLACPFSLEHKITRNYFYALYHFALGLKEYAEEFSQPEIQYKNIAGHPDLVAEHIIFDVKTTINFSSMMKDSLLQIFAYGALAMANGNEPAYVGVILPVQKKIITAPIINWDYKPYLKLLEETANSLDPKGVILLRLFSWKIGSHISKGRSLYTSLNLCKLPVAQVFLSSPRKREIVKITDSELDKLTTIRIPFFVHAPHYLNIAKNNDYQLNVLEHEFKLAKRMRAKGVVIHLGSNPAEQEGIECAKNNISTLLSYASVETPLLLETQAGEGNDLFVELDELIELYQSFNDKDKLKLCVDTCHVWAAGYNPYEYLKHLLSTVGTSAVALIHFNDCQAHRGSKKDRHAPYGHGYIGELIMGMCFTLACEHNIYMVME